MDQIARRDAGMPYLSDERIFQQQMSGWAEDDLGEDE